MISPRHRCIFIHIPKTAGTSIEAALGCDNDCMKDHRTIKKVRLALAPDEFRAHFKFTVVRNPWDRVVSWYKNVIADPLHRQKYGISATCSFREFLTVHGENWGLRSQLHWIRDRDGTIPLDFIGRFEHLHRDLARVCERIGAPDIRLSQHMMRSADMRTYTAFYDLDTRSIVAKRYAEEIELFGYIYANASEQRS